jgi:Holliday junction resolvase RusA-like endonuclease
MTQAAKNLKEAYMWEAKMQWKDSPWKGELGVTLKFFHKTNRRQDIDNFNKLVLDACSGVVWHDDSQITEMHLKKAVDKEFPRVEMTVWIIE